MIQTLERITSPKSALSAGADKGRRAMWSNTVDMVMDHPVLGVGIGNYPIQSGDFSTEGMTQAQLGYRQSFPSGDSRTFSTLRFESLSLAMGESASARQRDVLSQVRSQWLDAYYWQQARAMVMEKRPFFSDLVEITRSWYAVGRKTQQDVLRAELELNRIDDRLIEFERNWN